MNELFPIIRRKRRPLFVVDVPLIPTQTASASVTLDPIKPAQLLKADDAKSVPTTKAK
jgi:hypothetical protein